MTRLKTKRVLIVEDEVLLAMHLEDILTDLGHDVVGQATRIEMAMELAHEICVDFAILDINLAGTKSFPVAEILRHRGIPFAFASGYGLEGLADEFCDAPALQKPYTQTELERAISEACAGGDDDYRDATTTT